MIKLELTNFQSHMHSEIEVDGLTVLTGRTNAGKSAIIRALGAVIHNNFHPRWIRRGADQASVSITPTPDPQHPELPTKFTILKSTKAHSYQLTLPDGSTKFIEKAGRDRPPELEVIGFPLATTSRGNTINPAIQEQHEGLYLLGTMYTPTLTTDIINRLLGTNKLERALSKTTARGREANSRHTKLQKDHDIAKDAHEGAVKYLGQIQEQHARLTAILTKLDDLERSRQQAITTQADHTQTTTRRTQAVAQSLDQTKIKESLEYRVQSLTSLLKLVQYKNSLDNLVTQHHLTMNTKLGAEWEKTKVSVQSEKISLILNILNDVLKVAAKRERLGNLNLSYQTYYLNIKQSKQNQSMVRSVLNQVEERAPVLSKIHKLLNERARIELVKQTYSTHDRQRAHTKTNRDTQSSLLNTVRDQYDQIRANTITCQNCGKPLPSVRSA